MLTVLKRSIEKEEIEHLPLFVFGGEVIVVDKPDQVDAAVTDLEMNMVLGFDTETRPAFRKGEVYKVSLLQLATIDRVYLFRLHECRFDWPLRRLLENPKIIKVGVGIRDDIKHLQRLKPFQASAFLDMQDYAEKFGIADKSFSKLMAIIFGVKISKRQRTSNWELAKLTEAQIRYAATDAWGALKMYQHLDAGS